MLHGEAGVRHDPVATLRIRLQARFSLAEILVLGGAAGAGGIAPSTSTRTSTLMNVFRDTFHP